MARSQPIVYSLSQSITQSLLHTHTPFPHADIFYTSTGWPSSHFSSRVESRFGALISTAQQHSLPSKRQNKPGT